MNKNKLVPLYKWAGGKRREIKIFNKYFPDFVKNNEKYLFIEPFFGAGAVYWYLNNNKNIINDVDNDMMLFLKLIKEQNKDLINTALNMKHEIEKITAKEKEGILSISDAKTERGLFYYKWRNLDRNNGLENLDDWERAFRFIFMNQLAFNGMRRFNRKGEFNIPYGNYKTYSNVELMTDENYINQLKNTDILCGDFSKLLNDDYDDDVFIFLDPPYTREFKEYTSGNIFGNEDQIRLADQLKGLKKSKWVLIINNDDFTLDLYNDYIKEIYDIKYGTNIKNRYDRSTQHLIITNY